MQAHTNKNIGDPVLWQSLYVGIRGQTLNRWIKHHGQWLKLFLLQIATVFQFSQSYEYTYLLNSYQLHHTFIQQVVFFLELTSIYG